MFCRRGLVFIYVRDAANARSASEKVLLTIYINIDSNRFVPSQEDLKTTVKVKKDKKILRPQGMPTAGNVLDTIFGTGP